VRTIAIIQARMASSRLPGKVMEEIGGKPMLLQVIERARQSRQIQEVWVATTSEPADDPVEELCRQHGIACYRGSMHDVLDRFIQTARAAEAEVIVRLTADCPLLDPHLVDKTIEALGEASDFATNRLPLPWRRSFPIGLDTEVCSRAALERAWREASQTYQREHVMPYLYDGVVYEPLTYEPAPGKIYTEQGLSANGFRISQLHYTPDYGKLRWTVDTPADLEMVRQIFQRLPNHHVFSWLDVLAIFEKEPELAAINADIEHKTAYDVDARSRP
jgi:spore coat polysaccharide biosynthesis protein SpsF